MIIREDFDTKLRKALAIHYGLDKVYVQKINPTGFNAYRIEIKINDKFQWAHYLDELKYKYGKLHVMLVKYNAGKLNFTPTCPIDLLRKQASVMCQYLYILETRAAIENVDLNTEI